MLKAGKLVRVALQGVTCDGRVWNKGETTATPGPQLLALAQPGVLHWTGVNGADIVDDPAHKSARPGRPEKPPEMPQEPAAPVPTPSPEPEPSPSPEPEIVQKDEAPKAPAPEPQPEGKDAF